MATRVLLVDDHDGFRASARLMLESEGFLVVGEAADAATALVRAEELKPDLVLLDVRLPDGNGFDVADALADLLDGTDVLMISSRGADEYADRIRQSRARGFVFKGELCAETIAASLRRT